MKVVFREPKKARIEMIPLIDVIFFCLATFVLVTLTMNKNKAQKVNLAVGETGERPPATSDVITVSMTERGLLYWGADVVSYDQLLINLQALARENEPKLLLNFDQRALFAQGTSILDEVRKAGISKVQVLHRTVEKR
jgi:biopolymer transport protein ExbD